MTGFVLSSVLGAVSNPKSISWNIGVVGIVGVSSPSKSGGNGISSCVADGAPGSDGVVG